MEKRSEQENEIYLATGFREVDASGDAATFAACLRFLNSLDYFRRYKEESYQILDLQKGDCVLDAGCGLGEDLYQMAARITPGGRAVGIDASRHLIETARRDPRYGTLPVRFLQADLRHIPLEDASFTHVRIDRVLQHIEACETVLHELHRLLKTGGKILAYDNDWRSFSIRGTVASPISRLIETHWCDSFARPSIGAELQKLLQNTGFRSIQLKTFHSVIESFETADSVYDLSRTLHHLVREAQIGRKEAMQWIEAARGDPAFCVTLRSFLVWGIK